MRTIIRLQLRRFRRDRRGVSNIIVIVLSLVILTIIVSNVVLWSYQMNQLDWDKMREDIKITNVARATNSSWFVTHNEYTIDVGTRISGTYTGTQVIDGDYERFREVTPAPSYYSSGYNLLGSTQYYGESLSDLQSDDEIYMTFRSYVSATSTLAKTEAYIAYRSNTGLNLLNSPKERLWNGTAWSSSETEMTTAGSSVFWVRAASCSKSSRYYEKIVVTLSSDDYLDAYVWNGSSWEVTNNIGQVNTAADTFQSFDIAYEKTSGDAILVYAVLSTNTNRDLAYRIWNGATWSSEAYIDDTGQTNDVNYRWVELESNPSSGSNEIALITIDQTDADCNGWIWDGNGWGNFQELENNLASVRDNKPMAVAYEQNSGKAMFAWGYDNLIESRRWNGTYWENELPSINIGTANVRWISLKSDPTSNKLMAMTIDGGNDLNSVYWDGSAWGSPTEHDDGITHIDMRCADFDWEPSGSKGLLVWSTAQNSISYKTFTAPSTWSITSTISNPGTHPWIQLRRNPRSASEDVKILGVTLNSNLNIFGFRWDGSLLAFETTPLTDDTTSSSYESFDLEFQNFGVPTEFTSEVEFTGTSNTESWTELVWTVDSSFTTTSVTITLQLYNYNSEQYPTSGDGYMTDTIGTTDGTESQTITTNPTYFRDGAGNWKLKVKGVKATTTCFDLRADLVVFSPASVNSFQLDLNGTFTIDLSTYPLAYIQTVEILLRYRASDTGEKWYLKAYNCTSLEYSDNGFNTTAGQTPTTGWDNYAVNLTSSWRSYVDNNGLIYIKLLDNGPDSNSTTIDIDFLGVRAKIDGANFTFKNEGSLTSHLVSFWIINSTNHRRYDADIIINSADTFSYVRADVSLPSGQYTAKIVTERGNAEVYFGT